MNQRSGAPDTGASVSTPAGAAPAAPAATAARPGEASAASPAATPAMRELSADEVGAAAREKARKRRRDLLAHVGMLLLAAGFYAVAAWAGLFTDLEHRAHDRFFQWRNRIAAPAPPDDIVIVAIDDPSFRELELQWPWPRAVHADLVRALSEAGAVAVGFDVLFTDPSGFGEADDQVFAAAIAEAGNVILAEALEVAEDAEFTQQTWVRPLDAYADAARGLGMASVIQDPGDNFVRRAPLAEPAVGEPALGAVMAAAWLQAQGRPADPLDPVAAFGLPHPPDRPLVINYLGAPRTIPTVSYYQALDWRSMLPPGTFDGKLVFVGFNLAAAADVDAVDHFGYPFRGEARAPIPGVEVHATVADTLLRQRWILPLGPGAQAGLFTAFFLLGAAALFAVRHWGGVLAYTLAAALFTLTVFLCFLWWGSRQGLVVTPLGAFAVFLVAERAWKIAVVDREKRFVQKAFKHYVSPAVVDSILDDPSQLNLYGAYYETTVVFTDLVGFTSLAETWPPMKLRSFLTGYFTEMVEIMLRHRGTLDKFIGDAMMSFFGVPVRDERHALQGALCAWEMHQRLLALNREWQAQGLPPLSMRVGVNSGRVVAGNMGTATLFNYTIMGDCVNLGSRLEGANKFYGSSIMMGETTFALAGDQLDTRKLDRIRVKGKEQPITVYELLGPKGTLAGDRERPERLHQVRLYEAALEEYFAQRFAGAIARLDEALALGEDGPSEVLRERCREYLLEPPAERWDGVYALKSK